MRKSSFSFDGKSKNVESSQERLIILEEETIEDNNNTFSPHQREKKEEFEENEASSISSGADTIDMECKKIAMKIYISAVNGAKPPSSARLMQAFSEAATNAPNNNAKLSPQTWLEPILAIRKSAFTNANKQIIIISILSKKIQGLLNIEMKEEKLEFHIYYFAKALQKILQPEIKTDSKIKFWLTKRIADNKHIHTSITESQLPNILNQFLDDAQKEADQSWNKYEAIITDLENRGEINRQLTAIKKM